MNMTTTRPRLGATLALAVLASTATAGPMAIPLVNSDFEAPVLPYNNNWSSPVSGWNNSSPAPGVTFKLGTMPPASHGNQYVWCDSDSFDLTQTVSGTINSNSLYEVFVELWPLNSTNSSALVMLGDPTAGRYVDQRLYRPSWNTNLMQFALPTNQWTTVRACFHAADFPGIGGHSLSITLQGAHIAVDNVRLYRTPFITAAATNYFVSSSGGNDANNGLSPATAWQSFTNLNQRIFAAGSAIWLNRGDVWTNELNLRGSGAVAATNQLGAYGTGGRPLIIRQDRDFDRCIVLNNASHWRFADVECRSACLGLFLRYFESVGYQDITVQNCRFGDLDSWLIDPQFHNMEWSVPAAIWIGGILKDADTNATVLDSVTIRNCGMENVTCGIGSGYYYPTSQPLRVTHITIADSFATRVTIGGISFDSVSHAAISRFRTFQRNGKPGGIWTGSTGVMLSTCSDFQFTDCEFSDTDRAWADATQGDGCGFDFERGATSVTLRRCLFHDNDGEGILTLNTSSGAVNTNFLFDACTFWNNALDPSDATYSPGGNAYEIKFTPGTASGIVTNCGLYRSVVASNWYYPASLPSNIKLRNSRTLYWTNFQNRATAPVWNWNTNDNFEGWTNRNQWNSPAVAGGVLSGTAAGNDPFAYSPLLWVNTLCASPIIRVRMRSTAGNGAIFFCTEADPVFDGVKVVGFAVIADGAWHDYAVDLRASSGYNGVVTQIRIDPSDTTGAQFGIDSIRWQPEFAAGSLHLSSQGNLGSRLSFTADPGLTLRILASPDLANWTAVGTNTTDTAGNLEFLDTTTTGGAWRFYRVVWP